MVDLCSNSDHEVEVDIRVATTKVTVKKPVFYCCFHVHLMEKVGTRLHLELNL